MKVKHFNLPVEKLTDDIYNIKMTIHRKRVSILYHRVFDVLSYTIIRYFHKRRIVNQRKAHKSYEMKEIKNKKIRFLKIFDISADRMAIRIILEKLANLEISNKADIFIMGHNFNLIKY